MTLRTLKRLSTHITVTILCLVVGSVLFFSALFFIFLLTRMAPEFYRTLSAQPGEIEALVRHGLYALRREFFLWFGGAALFCIALAGAVSLILGRRLGRPLGEMAEKAIKISKGDRTAMFRESAPSFMEIGLLRQAFDQMLITLIRAEENSRYKELLGNVEDSVYIVNREGRLMDANEAAHTRLGYSRKAFLDLTLTQLLPENDAALLLAPLPPDGIFPKTVLNTTHLRENGERLPVEVHSKPILYRGRPMLLQVARDLSERHAAETALRESEHRYRSVVENAHSGILILSESLQILYENREAIHILEYGPGELRGMRFPTLLTAPPSWLEKDAWHLQPQWVDDQDLIRKDGTIRNCKIRADVLESAAGGRNLILQILDVTDGLTAEREKKQLEAQLLQATKMQAIGTLAGGVAHDFNNLLMAIQGRASLLRLHGDPDPIAIEYLGEIEKSIKDGAKLTRQLLGFARGGKYQAKPTDMNDLIEKNLHMFSRTHAEIRIHTRLSHALRPVLADQSQMEQVLMNLFLNAAHAMPNGGEMLLSTRNRTFSDAEGAVHGLPAGDYASVSVSDTGVGMEPEVMDRVFEPFFTTKPMGLGTGMGLASVYGIIQNHKGHIQVESKKGKGSTFHFFLPAAAPEEKSAPIRKPAAHTDKKTILLVDDRPEFLEIGCKMIEELGYHVESAASGRMALDLLENNALSPDIVVLDMVMPEMSGPEVFEKMKQIRKDLRILMCSGYSLDHHVERLMNRGCTGFIQKPFNLSQLKQALNDALQDASVDHQHCHLPGGTEDLVGNAPDKEFSQG